MKPSFVIPSQAASLTTRSVDLHDSVSRSSAGALPQADQLTALFRSGERRELQTGEWLFRLGDLGRRLFKVERGSLDVVVQGVDGHEQTLGRFAPGGVFGEVSFLLGGGRSASVRAHEQSVVIGIDWNEEDAIANGRLGLALATVLAQRLRSNNALLLDLLSDDDAEAAPSSKAVVTVSPTLTADRPQVVVRDEIRLTDLRDIINGRVLAVRVPGWYTSRQCQQLWHLCCAIRAFPVTASRLTWVCSALATPVSRPGVTARGWRTTSTKRCPPSMRFAVSARRC